MWALCSLPNHRLSTSSNAASWGPAYSLPKHIYPEEHSALQSQLPWALHGHCMEAWLCQWAQNNPDCCWGMAVENRGQSSVSLLEVQQKKRKLKKRKLKKENSSRTAFRAMQEKEKSRNAAVLRMAYHTMQQCGWELGQQALNLMVRGKRELK